MLAINRIREALSSPFNSPEPNFTRELWLKIILKLFSSIHEGLYNCQTIATTNLVPYDAFDDLTAGEVGVTSRIKEILEGIDDFFWREGNADPPTRIHCYRCISSATPPDPNPDSIKAITLSNALDLRVLRETLLNHEIRDLETEMTKWAMTQCVMLHWAL
jgi:hypothetical protein